MSLLFQKDLRHTLGRVYTSTAAVTETITYIMNQDQELSNTSGRDAIIWSATSIQDSTVSVGLNGLTLQNNNSRFRNTSSEPMTLLLSGYVPWPDLRNQAVTYRNVIVTKNASTGPPCIIATEQSLSDRNASILSGIVVLQPSEFFEVIALHLPGMYQEYLDSDLVPGCRLTIAKF